MFAYGASVPEPNTADNHSNNDYYSLLFVSLLALPLFLFIIILIIIVLPMSPCGRASERTEFAPGRPQGGDEKGPLYLCVYACVCVYLSLSLYIYIYMYIHIYIYICRERER